MATGLRAHDHLPAGQASPHPGQVEHPLFTGRNSVNLSIPNRAVKKKNTVRGIIDECGPPIALITPRRQFERHLRQSQHCGFRPKLDAESGGSSKPSPNRHIRW